MMPISKIASSRNEASIPTCRPIFSFFILYRIFEERNIQMRGYFWKKNKSLCNEVRLIKLWICTLANWLFSIPKRNIIDAVSVLAQRREHELWYSESILTGLKIMVLILSYKFFCCLIYIYSFRYKQNLQSFNGNRSIEIDYYISCERITHKSENFHNSE